MKKCMALPFVTHPGIELIGKTVKDAVSDGKIQYEAMKAVSDEFNTSGCTAIMDLTVEAEAFGAEIIMPEDEIPTVKGRLLKSAADVEELSIPDLGQGRVKEYLKANKLAAENITGKPVFSGCIGPFSLAGRLYDMSEIMISIYTEPETILLLLSKCTEFLIRYCTELKKTGTAGVVIAEPAAGLLSDEDCNMYSSDFVKKIVNAVQDDDFMVILHNCGNTGQCTHAMIASGANALHFGNAVDMVEVLQECPSDKIVMGNIDPVCVFKQSDPNTVREVTADLLERTKKYANFVISSGCDIPPHTPLENIRAFFEVVGRYYDKIKGNGR